MNTFMDKVFVIFVIFTVGALHKDVTGAALNWTEAHSKCHRENKCLTSNPPGYHHPRMFWGSSVILKSSFLSCKGCFRNERFQSRPNAITLANPGLAMCETACMYKAKVDCKPTLWIGMQGNSCFCWCNVESNVNSTAIPENPHMCNIGCGLGSWLYSGKCGGADYISLYKRGVFLVEGTNDMESECVTVSRGKSNVSYYLEQCSVRRKALCSRVMQKCNILRGVLEEDPFNHVQISRITAYWTNKHRYTQILNDCQWQYPVIPNLCAVLHNEKTYHGPGNSYIPQYKKCNSRLKYYCVTPTSSKMVPNYDKNHTTTHISYTTTASKGRPQSSVSESKATILTTSCGPAIATQNPSGDFTSDDVTQTILAQEMNITERTDNKLNVPEGQYTSLTSSPDILNKSLSTNTQEKQTKIVTSKVMITAVASSLVSVIALAALTTAICLCRMRTRTPIPLPSPPNQRLRKKLSHQEQTRTGNEMKSLNCRLSNPYVNGLSGCSTVDNTSNSTLQGNMHRKDDTENYYVSNMEETYDKLHGGRRRLQDDYASDIYSHANDPNVDDTEYSCASHNVDFVNEGDSYGHYGYTGQ